MLIGVDVANVSAAELESVSVQRQDLWGCKIILSRSFANLLGSCEHSQVEPSSFIIAYYLTRRHFVTLILLVFTLETTPKKVIWLTTN